MSLVCGWRPSGQSAAPSLIVEAMGRALRVHDKQSWACWSVDGLAVGLLDHEDQADLHNVAAPAVCAQERWHLWMVGEAFDGRALLPVPNVVGTRTMAFRKALLAALLEKGTDAIRDLDGEYVVILWDRQARHLTLLNDRFGSLPLYWGTSPSGFAFAGGVRGVLMAPGITYEPDPEAIREAVTFGGFRLGDRTNVKAVKMVPGASVVSVAQDRRVFRRYWQWRELAPVKETALPDMIERAHHLWELAIERRLGGARRPGQTLSGGLDSRAILAEAAPRTPGWIAITFGVPGCDDARYGQQAAAVMGATWIFHPLYGGRDPDWLTLRTSHIRATDGLVQLGDLQHLETMVIQSEVLDLHLSGYIGDVVCGPTYNACATVEDVLQQQPYYGTDLGYCPQEALALVRGCCEQLAGAPLRFAFLKGKLAQAINRCVGAAYRPHVRVRRPFVDYDFFDFFQGLPDRLRVGIPLYHHWLRARYPHCFAAIPNQKTGMPVITPRWRVQIERGKRLLWRKALPVLRKMGVPARPRIRSYTADEEYWRAQGPKERIRMTVLRPDSLCCDLLGRDKVKALMDAWDERGAAPAQVVALCTFTRLIIRNCLPSCAIPKYLQLEKELHLDAEV